MPKRVCILTAGSLASTPRMLKAADALHEAGYAVRVVDAEFADWADDSANELAATRQWHRQVVRWRQAGSARFHWTRVRHRAARGLAAAGPGRLPLGLLARAGCRVAPELVRAAVAQPADLVYAGTVGGLAVGALAARRLGVPYGLDLEDFHPGERAVPGPAEAVVAEVERRVLARAAFVTTSSEPIAAAYAERHRFWPVVVHNVFPLPVRAPDFNRPAGRPLTLFWFSQVVGPGRGLEEVASAVAQVGVPVVLLLLGNCSGGYLDRLRRSAGGVVVEHKPPGHPDRINEAARASDVGLASELPSTPNRDLCMTNKIFTYLMAGLAVAATDTAGQRAVLVNAPAVGFLYPPSVTSALTDRLRHWADDPVALDRAKRASWAAAVRRWHWDHPLEKGALLAAVAAAIGPP